MAISLNEMFLDIMILRTFESKHTITVFESQGWGC